METIIIKPRYAVVCPYCGAEAEIGPSFFMTSGMFNHGIYKCPKCGELVQVSLVDAGERMFCEKFPELPEKKVDRRVHQNQKGWLKQ